MVDLLVTLVLYVLGAYDLSLVVYFFLLIADSGDAWTLEKSDYAQKHGLELKDVSIWGFLKQGPRGPKKKSP